jgi:WD40 repeat protein
MDNHVRMWDLTNGQLVRDLDDHPDSVSCMACTSLTHVVTGVLLALFFFS